MFEDDYSPICGKAGCKNETIVNIWSHNVTRCAKHYCEDYDRHKTGHSQNAYNPERFTAEDDILNGLADANMLQKHNESKKDYSLRCRTYLKESGGIGALIAG